jgi:hypothetical protein
MRAIKLLLLLLIALPTLAGAQVAFVNVPGSNANYPNGTMTANFKPPLNASQASYSGQRFTITQTVNLNASGAWSLKVADNTTLIPPASQWQLRLCSQGTYLVAPTCYQVTMPVTCVGNSSCSGSTLDLTSVFAAAPIPPGTGAGSSLPSQTQVIAGNGAGGAVAMPEKGITVNGAAGTVAWADDLNAGIYDPRDVRWAGGIYGANPEAAAQAMYNQMGCDLYFGTVSQAKAQWPQGDFQIDQLILPPGSWSEGVANAQGGTHLVSKYNNRQIMNAPPTMTVTCSGTQYTLSGGQTRVSHFLLQGCATGGCVNAPGDTGNYPLGGPGNQGLQNSTSGALVEWTYAEYFGGYGIRIDNADAKSFHNTLFSDNEWYVFGGYKGVGESVPSPETSASTTGTTSSITLNWAAVTGATGYVVYRGTTAGGEGTFYFTNTNSFTDTGAAGTSGGPLNPATQTAAAAPATITPTVSNTGGTLTAGTYYYVVSSSTGDGWHGNIETVGADNMSDWTETYGLFDAPTVLNYHHLADYLGGGGDAHFDHIWAQLGQVGIAQICCSGPGDSYENIRADFTRLEGFYTDDILVSLHGGIIDASCGASNAASFTQPAPIGAGICVQLYDFQPSEPGGFISGIQFEENGGFGPVYSTGDYLTNATAVHLSNGTPQFVNGLGVMSGTVFSQTTDQLNTTTGATPTITGLHAVYPSDTSATTITQFFGSFNQDFWVLGGNANVTLHNDPANLTLCSGQDVNLGNVHGWLHFRVQSNPPYSGLGMTSSEVCPDTPIIASSETVTYSATPAFSTKTRSSIVTLTGNVSSFTLGAGMDGQEKTLIFCQDATGSRTVTGVPANVRGFFTIGSTLSKCSSQHFTYSLGQTAWLADSPGVTNQ